MNNYDSRYTMLQEDNIKAILTKKKTIVAASDELGVSRQTVHKWLLRYKRYGIDGLRVRRRKYTKKAHNRTSNEIEFLVETIAQKYWKDGVQTLSDRIKYEHNISLHPTTIYRILKRNDIRYTNNYTATKKRWKKKLFSHKTPGKELQLDTKYPFGYKQGKVIYTIIDDATRWVYTYGYEKATAENTLDFLKKTIKQAPFTLQKVRTDQGKEFIANKVKDYLKDNNIIHRRNTPYCPEENGKIERFHRTLNEKCIRYTLSPRDPLETLQYNLNLFIYYYNHQKRHRGLGMDGLTPMEKLAEYESVNLTLQCYIYC